MKVRVKKLIHIKEQVFEPDKEYELSDDLAKQAGFGTADNLAKWMVSKDIAVEVSAEPQNAVTPEAPFMPAYDKFLSLVGNHTIEIYGDYGTGKSRLVQAVAVEAQLMGKKVLYIDTEGSLSEPHIKELQNYEYVGDDLQNLVTRVEKAKEEKEKYSLLIVDSIGLPVLNAYARLPLEKKLEAIQKLAPIMADTVRFARDGNGLSIVTNQCVSEFSRVAKDLPPDEPLGPFGGKIAFVPKLILRSEPLARDAQKSEFMLLVWKARDLPRNCEVARFTIDKLGLKIQWQI